MCRSRAEQQSMVCIVCWLFVFSFPSSRQNGIEEQASEDAITELRDERAEQQSVVCIVCWLFVSTFPSPPQDEIEEQASEDAITDLRDEIRHKKKILSLIKSLRRLRFQLYYKTVCARWVSSSWYSSSLFFRRRLLKNEELEYDKRDGAGWPREHENLPEWYILYLVFIFCPSVFSLPESHCYRIDERTTQRDRREDGDCEHIRSRTKHRLRLDYSWCCWCDFSVLDWCICFLSLSPPSSDPYIAWVQHMTEKAATEQPCGLMLVAQQPYIHCMCGVAAMDCMECMQFAGWQGSSCSVGLCFRLSLQRMNWMLCLLLVYCWIAKAISRSHFILSGEWPPPPLFWNPGAASETVCDDGLDDGEDSANQGIWPMSKTFWPHAHRPSTMGWCDKASDLCLLGGGSLQG